MESQKMVGVKKGKKYQKPFMQVLNDTKYAFGACAGGISDSAFVNCNTGTTPSFCLTGSGNPY